jgi:hypothetical protein
MRPQDVATLTPEQAIDLLAEPNPTFKNHTEYRRWLAQRHKR